MSKFNFDQLAKRKNTNCVKYDEFNSSLPMWVADMDFYMAPRIKAAVISSVGMEDDCCPPRYFYQAYKKMTCVKELYPYEGYGHGGFEEIHLPKKIAFAKKILKCDY